MKHNDDSGVLEAFGRYTQAFQALDARAVARHFHEPAFFITPKDVVSLPTAAAVEQTYARVMADMPPDYVRTEFSPLSEHRLSDDLAMVSGSGVWKNAANEDLMPFGMTYTLRRSGSPGASWSRRFTRRTVVLADSRRRGSPPKGTLGRSALCHAREGWLAPEGWRYASDGRCDDRAAQTTGPRDSHVASSRVGLARVAE